MPENFVIIIPQFNDWEALNLLIQKINADLNASILENTTLFIVDDCSSRERTQPFANFGGKEIKVLRLYRNLGHQKAIAIGLSYVAEHIAADKVIVMDADGEDAPSDINLLAQRSLQEPGKIIFAERNKRTENLLFRSFYVIYKLLFKLLTGKVITFGNFSLVPQNRLQNLVRVSEIWNNYPGGIIKSRIPYDSVLTNRAKRLAGESKMNFVSLVLHGLSAISVLVDTTAVRILIFSIFMSGVAIAFIIFIIFLKLIGNATPGWASTLGSTLMILMLQSFLISLFLVFMVLQYRSQQHFIPAVHYRDFVEKVDTFS
ncbi:glycosyltransferase [Dyadobacter fanqingshengii]|uniref:Glycosyltransferase n=1 Tax=Dyadobacter fanqingshengii TaxID=2906443 RepID=A0A9X1PEW2_9BACT|nr:glycosyltransferase [Dyadobacter fanqingshengii]MCF0042413.1 glycosyltransferase [Dyadobacter fanqingshengii]MCF2506603.1 glycosyltransferase [Dyadobacter fanqingshengii]USJ35062.1 glycosyltransferase [Dyadobacter fanqingshengii]